MNSARHSSVVTDEVSTLQFLKLNIAGFANLTDEQIYQEVIRQVQQSIDIVSLTGENLRVVRLLKNILARLNSDLEFRRRLVQAIRDQMSQPIPVPAPVPVPVPTPTPVPPVPAPTPAPTPVPSPDPDLSQVIFPASGCAASASMFACAAGATASQIQTMINAAPDGAIIVFQPGRYSINTWLQYSPSKGATLICQRAGTCMVSTSGTLVGMNGTVTGVNRNYYRFSGFAIESTSTNFIVWFSTSWPGGSGTLTRFRIDHNTFSVPTGGIAILFGDNSSRGGYYYGLVDNNTLKSTGSGMLFHYMGGHSDPNAPANPRGTAFNLFVENNVIDNAQMTNASLGCTDSWGGAAVVFRYNRYRNCLVSTHGSLHAGGPQNWEFYGNTGVLDSGSIGSGTEDGYRMFHHHGSGTFTAFNNSFTAYKGKSTNVMAMMYYRDEAGLAASSGGSVCDGNQTAPFEDGRRDGNRQPTATYRGYPCWHQPGRDFAGNLQPMYTWNNKWADGSAANMVYEDYGGYGTQHVQHDRDYFNAVGGVQTSSASPFNGSTGMGFGTLANRPATCSVAKTDAADAGMGGVGYFATDVGPHGVLYQCSTNNTWREYYRPYVYPHPLSQGIVN